MRRIRAGGGGAGVTGSGGGGGGGTSAGSSDGRAARPGGTDAARALRPPRPGDPAAVAAAGNGSPRRRLQEAAPRPPPARTLLPLGESPPPGSPARPPGRGGRGRLPGRAPGDESGSRGAPGPAPPPRASPGGGRRGPPRVAGQVPAGRTRPRLRRGDQRQVEGFGAQRGRGRRQARQTRGPPLSPPTPTREWAPPGETRPLPSCIAPPSSLVSEMWRPQQEGRNGPSRGAQESQYCTPVNPGKSLEPGVAFPQPPPAPIHSLIHYSTNIFQCLPNCTVSLVGTTGTLPTREFESKWRDEPRACEADSIAQPKGAPTM